MLRKHFRKKLVSCKVNMINNYHQLFRGKAMNINSLVRIRRDNILIFNPSLPYKSEL